MDTINGCGASLRRPAHTPPTLSDLGMRTLVDVRVQWPDAAVPATTSYPATAAPFRVVLASTAPRPLALAGVRVTFATPATVHTVLHADGGGDDAVSVGLHAVWLPVRPSGGAPTTGTAPLLLLPGTVYVLPLAIDTGAAREAKVPRWGCGLGQPTDTRAHRHTATMGSVRP
jgi:hypothetical protein